jgi:hypothetical protein
MKSRKIRFRLKIIQRKKIWPIILRTIIPTCTIIINPTGMQFLFESGWSSFFFGQKFESCQDFKFDFFRGLVLGLGGFGLIGF